MPDIDPASLGHPLAGWAAFVGLLVTMFILNITGKITSGSITEMWKSAYENLRDAQDVKHEADEEEKRALRRLLTHVLQSFQSTDVSTDRSGGGDNDDDDPDRS